MRRLSLLATVTALAIVSLARPAQAATTTCSPSTVQVLFDRSTSMHCEQIGTERKWDIAVRALDTVLAMYQDKAAFGLTLFPAAKSSCGGGSAVVAPKVSALADVDATLTSMPAGMGMYTPIGQTLTQVASLPGMSDASKRRFVILVTDGKESCPGGTTGIPTTAAMKAKVAELKAAGITTYVVGFGGQTTLVSDAECRNQTIDGIDVGLLNQLAVGAGTALSGCDPANTSTSSTKKCYYDATDEDALAAALEEIVVQISTEICDGKDNDCNGKVDDNTVDSGGVCSTGKLGECALGHLVCVNGGLVCVPDHQPTAEICDDGKDNNCDGKIDETCECTNGDVKDCGKGLCAGHQTCVNRKWGACDGPAPTNQNECDGLDHNCDGVIDNTMCECTPGMTDTCGGPTVPNSPCKAGTRTCDATGHWGDCVGAVGPQPETCDGIDNNCDGQIDNPTISVEDDVPHGLCRVDQICQSGHCVSAPPVVKPPTGGNVVPGEASGCACEVGGGSSTPVGGALLALALGAVFIRRRK